MAGAAFGLLLSWPARVEDPGAARPIATALALRAQAGEDRAFDELMQATEERVLTVAWRLLGSREEARDAAQETFLRAYRSLRRYRPEHDFEAWLYGILVNVCRDLHRRRRFLSMLSLDSRSDGGRPDEPFAPADSEERLLEGERRSLLLRAMASLPPRQRAALVLRDLEGKTSEQVAAILGTSAGTVRAQLASARAKLKLAIVRLASPRGRPR